ncbi:hypothetical protein KCU98_g7686, partial [Aureobasidium melanogenum]
MDTDPPHPGGSASEGLDAIPSPNGVIANVPPPVLTSVATPPTELEVTDEVPDDDDYDEHEEDDLKRKNELEEMLEQADAMPRRTGTPKRRHDSDDDEDQNERDARNRDFGRIWRGRLLCGSTTSLYLWLCSRYMASLPHQLSSDSA